MIMEHGTISSLTFGKTRGEGWLWFYLTYPYQTTKCECRQTSIRCFLVKFANKYENKIQNGDTVLVTGNLVPTTFQEAPSFQISCMSIKVTSKIINDNVKIKK